MSPESSVVGQREGGRERERERDGQERETENCKRKQKKHKNRWNIDRNRYGDDERKYKKDEKEIKEKGEGVVEKQRYAKAVCIYDCLLSRLAYATSRPVLWGDACVQPHKVTTRILSTHKEQ